MELIAGVGPASNEGIRRRLVKRPLGAATPETGQQLLLSSSPALPSHAASVLAAQDPSNPTVLARMLSDAKVAHEIKRAKLSAWASTDNITVMGSAHDAGASASRTVAHVNPREVAGVEALLEAYFMQVIVLQRACLLH